MKKAIFIDKDGTLIPDIPYNADPEKITLTEKAGESLFLLQESGYEIYVISNQPGLAMGLFSEHQLLAVKNKIAALLQKYQVTLSGFYYCPHHASLEKCDCRKPMPGMLLKAAQERHLDLPGSWMIGDILHDVEAGNRAGCRTILINNGNETRWEQGVYRIPDFQAPDLQAAAVFIINEKVKTRTYAT